MADHQDTERAFSMQKARKIWAAKGGNPDKRARKHRHNALAGTIDKRALRATGRTEQFNFRASAEIKAKAHAAAVEDGMPLAQWMEMAVEALAQREEKAGDA